MRRRILPLLTLAVLLVPAAHATAAPDTVIGFEGLPQNQNILDQYAAQGVRFGSASRFGVPAPTQDCGGGQAYSPGISGGSNQIACATGSVEFPNRRFATTIEFATERPRVEFDLRQQVFSASLGATVRAFGVAGNVLSTSSVTLDKGVTKHVVVAQGTSTIAYVQVSGNMDYSDSGQVLLDNLVAKLDDAPPPAKWALALTNPSADVVEGSSVTTQVSVRRFNGSTGPVNLSVPSLPSGIVATQFSSASVTGTDPVDLKITANKPLAGERQITVNATGGGSAGTGVVTSAVQTVVGKPAITIAEGGRFTRTVVAGCGTQPFDEYFDNAPGYSGTVFLAPTGNGASAAPGSVFANAAGGTYKYTLNVNPGPVGGIQTVGLRVNGQSATPAALDVAFRTVAATVSSVTPVALALPRLGTTGEVVVRGNFPAACAVKFLDPLGQELVAKRGTASTGPGTSEDAFTLTLPANAVPGPIRVVGPSGAEVTRTAPLDLTELRNVFALRQPNSGSGAGAPNYTWNDFVRTFGDDDAESCFIFCVRDGTAEDYWKTFRTSVQSYGGLCAGYTQMAMRFLRKQQSPATYEPGRTRAYDILNFADGTLVKQDIVRWQVAQNDKGFGDRRTAALNRSAADERTVIKQWARDGQKAYVSIRNPGGGHAVVLTDWQDTSTPTGPGMIIGISDPNAPYSPGEATTLATRTSAYSGNQITIQGDGSWSGPASLGWTGMNNQLGIIRDIPPDDPDLAGAAADASVSGADGSAPAGEITQIAAGGKPALRDDFEGRAGSGVTYSPDESGVKPLRKWTLKPGKAYALTVTGTGTGTIRPNLLAGDTTASVETKTAKGRKDVVRFTPGAAQVGFAPGGKGAGDVAYDVAQKVGKGVRSATVSMRGGDDQVALERGALTIANGGGATTASVMISSTGTALPSSATTSVRVGAGQRVALAPGSWKDVGRGVKVTVRNARGKVVRRGRAKLRTTRVVSLRGVRARRKGAKVVVTGRVGKRGKAPLLAAVVGKRSATLRGRKVKAGKFTLTIRKAPKGKPVVIKLLDEAAGLASVTKRVRVR